MPDSTAIPPAPKRRPVYEFKATDCVRHEGRCAMRRERGVGGAYECVFCANEQTASALLEPTQDLAAAAVPEPAQTPPATTHAVEAAKPPIQPEDGSSARVSPESADHVWSALNLMAGKALERFGFNVRAMKLLEEMGELQSELAKKLLGHKRADDAKVIDEIADVFITLESVACAFGFDAVEAAIMVKLDRLGAAIADNRYPALFNEPPRSPEAAESAKTQAVTQAARDHLPNDHEPSRCATCAANGITQRDARGRVRVASEPPASASTASSSADAVRNVQVLAASLESAAERYRDDACTAEAYGVELLRISHALATVSRQVRGRG